MLLAHLRIFSCSTLRIYDLEDFNVSSTIELAVGMKKKILSMRNHPLTCMTHK